MTNHLKELRKALDLADQEYEKFYSGGVDASGTRLRSQLQTIKDLAQKQREDVLVIRNARKTSRS